MAIRLPAGLLRTVLRILLKPFLGPPFSIGFQRFWVRLVSIANPVSRAASTSTLEVEGMFAVRARPKSSEPNRTVLYFHGGAYCIGSWQTYRGLITHLAVAADAVVYSPNYRLAPEDPHPAALEDGMLAYRWLLDQGIRPGQIALAGDSAGAGLALATAVALRDSGLPLPASIVLLSPGVDLSGDYPSMRQNARKDPMIRPSWFHLCASLYLGGRPPDDPACSPLFANHEGLPPMLIHVGTDEVLLDDSTRLAERCREAGVDVTLKVFEGMWHEFQIHAGLLKESDEAAAEIGEFLQSHFSDAARYPR
ncbi:MAG: alpha/beta hydrolase [Polyangiales bacterium]